MNAHSVVVVAELRHRKVHPALIVANGGQYGEKERRIGPPAHVQNETCAMRVLSLSRDGCRGCAWV
eukprot:2434036-Pleurochrysis_carterae.AAC.2